MAVDDVSATLLAWYDADARDLPWRSAPGTPPPPPYRVWLSEVMLQQTTTATVAPYFARFLARWPTVAALTAADDADVMREWAGLGYYARARNLLACARTVATLGAWPKTEEGLRALPGVGKYTAAAIAAIAFERRAVVVDGNVERVVARLFAVATPIPAARRELHGLADHLTPATRAGDFAQAMMDLGATICLPRAPKCERCPLASDCVAFAGGDPARYPVRLPKPVKPVRFGTACWIEHDGAVLLERRPGSGLLGGMLGLPTSEWTTTTPIAATRPTIRHVFTHFELQLAIAIVRPATRVSLPGEWQPVATIADAGLPTLFARATALALRLRAEAALSPSLEQETAP